MCRWMRCFSLCLWTKLTDDCWQFGGRAEVSHLVHPEWRLWKNSEVGQKEPKITTLDSLASHFAMCNAVMQRTQDVRCSSLPHTGDSLHWFLRWGLHHLLSRIHQKCQALTVPAPLSSALTETDRKWQSIKYHCMFYIQRYNVRAKPQPSA